MEIISTPPPSDSFTPLTSHESQTPQSFFTGKPVLHYHDPEARILISRRHLTNLPILKPSNVTPDHDQKDTQETINGDVQDEHPSSKNEDEDEEVVIPDMKIWVTSQKVILFNPSAETGVTILYPSIILHAIQRLGVSPSHGTNQSPPTPEVERQEQGIYMQISIPGGPSSEEANYEDENEDIEIVDLKIIPSSAVPAPTSTTSETSAATQLDSTTESPIQRFFAAISTCSNLHPDPIPGGGGLSTDDDIQDGNEDEDDPIIFEGSVGYESILMPRSSGITTLADTSSMPPPMPGSSGWITAENVNEFFDEEGNFKGRDGDDDEEEELRLGPGAGSIRTRDEDVDVEGGLEDAEGGRDGSGREVAGETEEMETSQTKWRRTG